MLKLFSLALLLLVENVVSIEYIPALVWESGDHAASPSKTVPGLKKMSSDTFKDLVFSKSTHKDLVILFAEENLSIEDFSWVDGMGESSYNKLGNVTSGASSQLLSAVENPVDAMLSLKQKWERLPTKDLPAQLASKKHSSYILVHLDDALDMEDRPDMLQRHDSIIADAFNAAKDTYDNVLAIYTGYHTSWVPVEENIRRVRHLLAEEEPPLVDEGLFVNAEDSAFLYSSEPPQFIINNLTTTLDKFLEASVSGGEEEEVFKMSIVYEVEAENATLTFFFPEPFPGYWELKMISLELKGELHYLTSLKNVSISAPFRFSYHCGEDIYFKNETMKSSMLFIDFQIEPRPNKEDGQEGRFNDAYDCIYFFTVPILSGLAVTILLIFILTLGLTMILDIKTMDRFDDPKGKTITINATE